jgi:Tfp pilus assembly protein PilO
VFLKLDFRMVHIKTFIKIYKECLTKAGIMWAACLVLFVLAYLFVLGPQINGKKHLENNLKEKKQQYETAQIAAREQTRNRLNEEIKSMQSILKNFVVDLKDSANLTFDIGKIANEEQVSSFSIGNKDKQGISEIPDCNAIGESHIVIGFIAGFNQFATFVNALERHQPVLLVNEFRISRSNRDKTTYQVTLDVAAFVRKQQERQIAGQPPVPDFDSKI